MSGHVMASAPNERAELKNDRRLKVFKINEN